MTPWVTLALCDTCGKPMNKSPIGDLWECPNFDCPQFAQSVSENEIENEDEDF